MTSAEKAREALSRHGFHFTKSLGQNFLLNDGIITRVADAAGATKGENILEIGAGAGVLTRELALRGGNVVALEVDKSLAPVLSEVLSDVPGARVLYADALKCDLNAVFGGAPFRVAANLPYYITSDLLLRLATEKLPVTSATVMVQKEAAERILSVPGEKSYCALSAVMAYFGASESLFDIPPSAFTPSPHVLSALVRIDFYGDAKPVRARCDEWMLRVIRAAFAMRRKTLQNNLSAAFSLPGARAKAILESLSINPSVRGEALSLADLARIADALAEN